ncbi:Gfo/Idh/MocA family protein [Halovenus marina]|uniref:Gfo/Idh/MocA family protein n=1 Tax=Halovenus marina TaxID=3396621 RepID=UPI003F57CE80
MTYTAGIIGAGGIAGLGILGMHDEDEIGKKKVRASHAGGYDATSDIELVAVADTDPDKLNTFADAWDLDDGATYTDHTRMLQAESLDVVSVATPTLLHAEHVLDAVEHGSPQVVWCEKPIASSLEDANRMIDRCEETETELVINHSFRFTDKLQQLRTLIHEEGLLGEIRSVSTQFRMELLRNSTHLLDTLVYLLDARPSVVNGYITGENEAADSLGADQDVDDAAGGGFVVMDDDTFVTIDCTIPRDISSMNLSFIGSEGKLYMNNDDGEWRYWSLEDGEHVELPLPGIEGEWTWDEDYERAFANAANHIQDILNDGVENISPGVEAAKSLEIIIGFYVSHYTNGTCTVPLDRPLNGVEITSW